MKMYTSKSFCSFALMAITFLSLFSCSSNENPVPESTETGNVKVSFGFDQKAQSKALTASTAKPTTGWSQNVKQMMILFVDQSSGMVKAARTITVPTENTTVQKTTILQNVPAGTFDAYLIANYNETALERQNIGALWNEGNVVGKNINTLTLKLVTNADFTPTSSEVSNSAFKSPAEIFMAKQNVTVVADQSSVAPAFTLTRVVSILRVRIDQSQNGNNIVKFDDAKADLRIRKISTTFNPKDDFAGFNATNLIYAKGASVYKKTDPQGGYTGTILDPANQISLWSDALIFPGGSKTAGAQKFDIVLGAMAPAGYVPLGKTQALTTPTMVYWSGQVQDLVAANNILEVNCILKQAGSTDVPEVGSYGNLELKVNIAEWGSISSTNIEM